MFVDNVVSLCAIRAARKTKQGTDCTFVLPPDGPRLFCVKCDTDEYKLYKSGAVHCINCGSLMLNITWSKNGSAA